MSCCAFAKEDLPRDVPDGTPARESGRQLELLDTPPYFFDVKNGHRLIDPAGLECDDEEEAIRTAAVIARQIATDAPTAEGRHVAVLNSEREEVGKVRIATVGRETA
jgi:hypothetical protein